MKGSARRLVYVGNVVVASGVVALLANCGGGERPQVSDEPGVDAGPSTPVEAGTSSVVITGYDPEKGINFGEDGFTNCGTQAPDKIISLRNTTSDVVNFEATLTAGANFYTLNPSSGGVPIRGTATIQIAPKPIPQDSDVAPDLYAGTLELRFPTTGEPPTVIRLHQTAKGAIIKSTVAGGQIDFGAVKVNTAGTQQVSFTNSGNAEVTADFLLGTQQFKIDGATAGSAKVGGGETVSRTITFNPTDIQAYTDTLAVSFNSSAVHCQPPPANIALKGSGTSSVTVSPGIIDIGQVDCGTTADFRTVTIDSTIAASFSATLAGGSTKYTLADNNGNAVTQGNAVPLTATVPYILRVVPKQVPIPSATTANGLADELTITTTAPGDQPKTIPIRQTARGAILGVTPATIANTGSIGQIFNNALNVVNTGNAPANFTLAVTDYQPTPSVATFSLNTTSGSAQVGSTPVQLTVTLPSTPNQTQLAALQLGVANGAVLCQQLPGKYALSAATGNATSITVNPASLNFGQVDCNTTAPFQTLTITSIQSTTVTPTLGLGASSPYTLADGTGSAVTLGNPINLTANVAYTLRVVPKLVPIPSSTANNALGDTLTLTSPVDPPKVIALSETARGAVFSYTPTSITGANGPYTITVLNSGNATGGFTLNVTGSGSIQAPATGTLLGGGSTTRTLDKTGAGSVSLATTSVRCADLPPPLTFGP